MKKARSRKSPLPEGARRSSKSSRSEDPFFVPDRKRRRKIDDDFIDSDDEEDEIGGTSHAEGEREGEEEEAAETADEKRLRVANAYLEKIRAITRRAAEEEEEEEEEEDGEREEKRDSLVAKILQQEQLEDSGRVRRLLASRVQEPKVFDEFHVVAKHRQSVTAVALADDDSKGFSASKDGTILHWDVVSGKGEKYSWPNKDILNLHGAKDPKNPSKKLSKHVLALAVSSDGRYLATGGLDRHVHLWDTRTREHIRAFPGHRGPVSCLTFRQGSSLLISGSFDRTIMLWDAEDRAFLQPLFGHQSEVLTIDCLRKERLLTVGRDRTMRLWKVPEESQLVFRAPTASLECCRFINNEEFLTGSDDGSIELWSVMRKKPTCIVKNAHAASAPQNQSDAKDNGSISNGDELENGHEISESHCSSAKSWVSSVTVCRGTDLAASGAGNGVVRLWAVENDANNIRWLYDLPLAGFVNSLVFARSGRFIVAGVGQEPRLGRWGRISSARNGVAVHSLALSEEGV
ncbi:U3 snoRNP-associated protein-like EMB2271 [Magnolia sinica]|uniref:U3 snoRNP-associated protein-like EMB2271 n=1 Tax=Magnolia sinica TaxID=86752 RepID=UPI0026593034|nr:U3 snoRNP-associated protein-like EMB2271 [Magnolia sinica]